jgi:UDP-glucose:(heptosyl)LPS alpha-1,3-glucosyltransferase
MPDKKLNIAIIRQSYRFDGGAERFVARAISALSSKNVDVSLIARKWSGDSSFTLLSCNPFYIGRIWREISFVLCACRTVRRNRFDIVQSHERLPCCDIYRAGDGVHRVWLKQRSRTMSRFKALLTSMNPFHLYVKHAEKQMVKSKQLKAIICNSKMVKDEIIHWFGVPDSMIHVIYSGVDLDHFTPEVKTQRSKVRADLNIAEPDTVFLFVGSGFARKGVLPLLKALHGLPENTHAIVIGHDKELEKYKSRAQKLGLNRRVHFLGKIQDVRPYYGCCDAFVLPTLYDPFPNVILEAMACGLPVITSTKCGGAEFIRQGVNGYIVDSLDIQGLSESMRKLMDSEKSVSFGISSRAHIENFGLSTMSNKLTALYEQVSNETKT